MNTSAQSKSAANRLKSLSWRFWFIAGYVVVALVFIVCSIVFVYHPINTEVASHQTETLITTAQASANALANSSDAQAFVDEATHNTELRMSVIAQDGTVLADSELDATTLDNHRDREEVTAALAGNVGSAQRTSESDEVERIYIAVPATFEASKVALRISEPSSAVEVITASARTSTFIVVITGCIVIVIVALVSLHKSRAPFRQLNQVRSDFVANASHELKTPVAGIRLLSEAIRDAAESHNTGSLMLFLDRLDSETERLRRLVVDLLDLSRLETAPQNAAFLRTDIHAALVTSYIAHQNEAAAKQLDLVFDDRSSPHDDCYVNMEPSDASLIFDNLIENAIMYTDEGSILVTFEPHPREFAVIVEDTGLGIPQADQMRIFERFYRVDKARSRKVGGTGLGLSLVRHAVERAKGSIHLKSTVGQGTQFVVTIPRSKKADKPK